MLAKGRINIPGMTNISFCGSPFAIVKIDVDGRRLGRKLVCADTCLACRLYKSARSYTR